MKKKLTTFLQYTAFIALAGFLLWLALRDIEVEKFKESLKNANYWWILLSLALGMVSHVSRSIRWNMLIKPLGYTPRLINTFFAVMIGYFANLAFPRLGEVSKCGILRKYENVPINKLLGTMIVERAADLIALLVLMIATILLEFNFLKNTIFNNVINPLQESFAANYTLILIAIGILLFLLFTTWAIYRKFKHRPFFVRIRDLIIGFVEGLKTIKNMDNFWAFLFHSIFIWALYYAMTYVAFFAFGATEHLGMMAGLVVFIFGSIGMVMPLPGGIGSYHALVRMALALYSIAPNAAAAYAVAVHGGQTFAILLFGFLSLILLPVINRKQHATSSVDLDLEESK